MEWLWVTLGIVGGIILLILLLAAIGYFACFFNNEKGRDPLKKAQAANYGPYQEMVENGVRFALEHEKEVVQIRSRDGKLLTGYFYEQNQDRPILLEFHGYKDRAFLDLGCGLSYDFKEGLNIFMCDQRSHGASEGRSITFGTKEKDDVLLWCDYIAKRFPNRTIILYGVSMGASSVLLASSANLPKEIKGIVADCPYTSPREITVQTAKKLGIPSFVAYPILYLGALFFAHFDLNKANVIEEVKKTTRPIYLIHGLADHFVPVEHSKRIQEANPGTIELSLFEGARHGMSFCVDPYRYIAEIEEFIKRCE